MNPLPGYGNPDLYVTGAFQKGIEIVLAGDKIEITSKDRKTPFLERRDPRLFGLTDENMIKYRQVLFPLIMDTVNKQLHK